MPHARLIALGGIAALAAGAAGANAQVNVITPASLDGATTGQAQPAYVRAFGRPMVNRLEGNVTRLNFDVDRTEVYLGRNGRGTMIVTGNPGFRTASGVGPCSSYADLKAAFPGIKRVSGTFGLGWRAGRLWFRVDDGTPRPDLSKATVSVVALVPGRPPAIARTALGNSSYNCVTP